MEELVELKLPADILDNVPKDKEGMLKYLSGYFDVVIEKYNERFQSRVSGIMGQPLSRYERAMLKDLLMDLTIGTIHQDKF
jgi:hypothetical protein